MAAYFGNIGFIHTFTPAIINVARFTAQRNNTMQNYPVGTLPGPSQLGVGVTPDLTDGPTVINLIGSGLFAGYNPFGPANIVDCLLYTSPSPLPDSTASGALKSNRDC